MSATSAHIRSRVAFGAKRHLAEPRTGDAHMDRMAILGSAVAAAARSSMTARPSINS